MKREKECSLKKEREKDSLSMEDHTEEEGERLEVGESDSRSEKEVGGQNKRCEVGERDLRS